MVTDITGLDAFFAEEVQDLNGLDTNILNALRDCVAFITVLHPRGKIVRPGGKEHIRASVWIEQEIAIATYITRVEKRQMPVIAFVHSSVGREGLRDLVHLNPIEFTDEKDVLAALPQRLQMWGKLKATAIVPEIKATPDTRRENGHEIRRLVYSIVNNSSARISQFNGSLRIPESVLKHPLMRNRVRLAASASNDPRYKVLQFDESDLRAILPESKCEVARVEYCLECATALYGAVAVDESKVDLTIWIESKKYHIEKTFAQIYDELADAIRQQFLNQ